MGRAGLSTLVRAAALADLAAILSAGSKGIVMRPGALRAATARAAAQLGKMRTRLAAGDSQCLSPHYNEPHPSETHLITASARPLS